MAFVNTYWKKSRGKKGPVRPLHEGVTAYINGEGGFGTQTAIDGRGEIQLGTGNMMLRWQYNGWEYADLARVARRTLSQAVSASTCERNWSTWDGVHTARRNRLGYKVRDLVYVAHNWNVVHNFHKDAGDAGPSVVGRKGAVVEGNIPPPPLPEGYKLEEDGEVEVDEDDVCFDEWEKQDEWKRRVDVGGPGDPSTGVVVHPEAEGRHECIRPRWCKVSLVRADARAADTAVATAAAVAAAAAAAAGVVLGTSSCSSSQQKFFFFQSPFLKAGREAHDGACRRIGACRYRVG
ncbi:unnamed protein product [Closterium sp. NIES-53]